MRAREIVNVTRNLKNVTELNSKMHSGLAWTPGSTDQMFNVVDVSSKSVNESPRFCLFSSFRKMQLYSDLDLTNSEAGKHRIFWLTRCDNVLSSIVLRRKSDWAITVLLLSDTSVAPF